MQFLKRDRVRRVAAISVSAVALAGAATTSLATADDVPDPTTVVTYDFASDRQGWTDTAGCEFLGVADAPGPFCAVDGDRDAEKKAEAQSFEPLVNAGQALVGTVVSQSPKFTLPATPEEIGSAALRIDRTADIGGLLEAGGRAQWSVALVDQTPNTTTPPLELLNDELTASDADTVTRTVPLDGAVLDRGKEYRLRVTTTFTSETAQVIGASTVWTDNVALTVLPPLVGPKGLDGANGVNGTDGTAGTNGTNGANGTDGANGKDGAAGKDGAKGDAGAKGEQGSTGASGTDGAAGPQGIIGMPGLPGTVRTIIESRTVKPVVNSAEARRLLRIDTLRRVRFRGPFANQLRLASFCRTTVLSRCEGTVKIRTVGRVNVALKKGRKQLRRVTLGTASYQLARRQRGYAKVFLTPVGQRLVKARAPIAVNVQVTVIDQRGIQQRLSRTMRVRLG